MLLPEAEPEPGVDERGVARGDDGVVRRAALVDPAGCREGIEVARRLCVADSVAGGSTQTFGPQIGLLVWRAEQVADDRSAAARHRARGLAGREVAQIADLATASCS